jgi:predicted metal-dependent hydrolase
VLANTLIGYNVFVSTETASAYSEEHILAYPVEYLAGIDLYNAGEFHAAHDAWEERWMGPVAPDEKLFLQAMIQSAVAFHHLQIGRPGAARQMYLAAKEKFARLGCKDFMSLDLEDYQRELDRALSWLLTVPDPREIVQPEIKPPTIRLLLAVTVGPA